MTYKTGSAAGHDALLEELRKWITGYGTATTPDGTGNTGNGTMSAVSTSINTGTETWTVTCTDDSGSGNETWSVTGSVSGLQTNTATTGVAYTSDDGTVRFTITDGATDFIVGDEWTFDTTEGAVKTDGYEWINLRFFEMATWTRSGTTATVTWPAHGKTIGQTVVITESSDTGAITNATKTITAVATDTISFTCLNAGATAGVCTITSTYNSMTQDNLAWTRASGTATVTWNKHSLAVGQQVEVTNSSATGTITNATKTITAVATNTISFACTASGSSSGTLTLTMQENHVYLKGLGNGGTDEIYVQLRSYKNTGTGYYNIELRGATGFSPEAGTYRTTQSNVSDGKDICLSSGTLTYWFMTNGRRFMIVAKSGTVFESAYAGFILPAGLPSEYPYPLAIGGSQGTPNRLVSDSSGTNGHTHQAFWNPGASANNNASLTVLNKAGAWVDFYNYNSGADITSGSNNKRVHPWGAYPSLSTSEGAPIYPCLNSGAIDASSGYALFPSTLLQRTSSPVSMDTLGGFEGVYHVSGHNNASENIVQMGGVDHLVVQNTYQTSAKHYAAFALE